MVFMKYFMTKSSFLFFTLSTFFYFLAFVFYRKDDLYKKFSVGFLSIVSIICSISMLYLIIKN